MAVGETAREAALKVDEKGFGLESRAGLQSGFELWPELGEGVGVSAPVPVHGHDLAGQLAESAILASRFGIHAGACGGDLFGDTLPFEAPEPAYLLIGDHREPPC